MWIGYLSPKVQKVDTRVQQTERKKAKKAKKAKKNKTNRREQRERERERSLLLETSFFL